MKGPNVADWPDSLREVAEVVGTEDALRLARACGGVALTVPRSDAAAPEHPWRRAVGAATFSKLVAAFGGRRMLIPRGLHVGTKERKSEVLKLREQGLTAAQIALDLGVTERHVRRILAASKAPSPTRDT